MDDAQDLVQVIAINREFGEGVLSGEVKNVRRHGICGDSDHLGARNHHLANEEIAKVENGVKHLLGIDFNHPLNGAGSDEHF